jgi:hypothetical protein
VHEADNLTAICEPFVQPMWDPPAKVKNFKFSMSSRPALESTESPIQ